MVAHRRLHRGPGRADPTASPAQNIGAAGLVDADGVGRGIFLAFLLSRLEVITPLRFLRLAKPCGKRVNAGKPPRPGNAGRSCQA